MRLVDSLYVVLDLQGQLESAVLLEDCWAICAWTFLEPGSLSSLIHPLPPATTFTPPPQIYFWEFQLQNETERLRTLFLPELGVKLKNLTGYTTYMISVAAFNAAGDGPRSLPTRGRTQQAGGTAGRSDPDVAAQSCSAVVRRFLLRLLQQHFKWFAINNNK